jgi:hypothetical protein
MTRSFLFTGFSLLWTYAVGACEIGASSAAATAAATTGNNSSGGEEDQEEDEMYHAAARGRQREVAQLKGDHTVSTMWLMAAIVQPFTQCQLRFAVLLFVGDWHLPVAAIAMGLVMAEKLRRIVHRWSRRAASEEQEEEEEALMLLCHTQKGPCTTQSLRTNHSSNDGEAGVKRMTTSLGSIARYSSRGAPAAAAEASLPLVSSSSLKRHNGGVSMMNGGSSRSSLVGLDGAALSLKRLSERQESQSSAHARIDNSEEAAAFSLNHHHHHLLNSHMLLQQQQQPFLQTSKHALVTLKSQELDENNEDEDETLALFRQAKRAAAAAGGEFEKLGEMI